jgi:hypothetical protein
MFSHDPRNAQNPDTLPFRVTFQGAHQQNLILAAFRLQSTHRLFLARCHKASPADVIRSLIEEAVQNTITMNLSGTEGEYLETVGALPYDELLAALQEGLAQVTALKNHQHQWVTRGENGPSYCCICTMPGDI